MKKLRVISLVMVATLALSVNVMGMTQSRYKSYSNSRTSNGGTYVISNNGSTFTYSSNGVVKTVILSCDSKIPSKDKQQDNCINNSCIAEGGNCLSYQNSSSCEGSKKTVNSNQGNNQNTNTNNNQGNIQNTNQNNNQGNSQNTNQNNNQGNSQDTNQNSTGNTVSEYAQVVVNLVNVERAKAGLKPLEIDAKVASAAQIRAKEVITVFSHTRPDGSSCFTALSQTGALYKGAGENIARGQRSPEQVVKEWMASEGHRANILNGNFKYIGVGVDGTAWVQLFTY